VSTADLSKKPAEVAAMFDDVAEGYDRTNAFLSGGNSALWRIVTVRQLAPAPGMRILDLAAGTGTSSVPLARAGAEVVAADFSPGMLAVGRRKHAALTNLSFVEADAISFGLRNVVEPKKALAEMFRVTKPGGRIVITEFSTPPQPLMRLVYRTFLTRVMPLMSVVTSTNSAAYTYLADSIEAWPNQSELAKDIHAVGFRKVAYRNLTGGIVALHRGIKPSA
jgi:demethylmenaquinone methyltransferase/2-methoxy-6-polyprenyl-1,4-benzoquinol methylase